MLLKLAWRNLWRQKRRTLLTASALALALLLSLMMRSLQEGSYDTNINNAARFYTGLLQIQDPEYFESNSIDDLLPQSPTYIAAAKNLPTIQNTLARLESFALAASDEQSKGVIVLGVEPDAEDQYSGISNKLIAGEFLKSDDQQVLVGESLAKFLGLEVGGEIVLYGQGYRGQTAAGLYKVKGILHFPMAQLDGQLVYMPLALAQQLYSTGPQVSAWVLHTHDLAQLPAAKAELTRLYGERRQESVNKGSKAIAKILDWQQLSPEMAQQIMMDRSSGLVLMYLLYAVVGFGLFATLLMMTLERQREFAVMLAAGLVRGKLVLLISIESLFIGLLGSVIGLALALPLMLWFSINPIVITGETAKAIIEMGFEPIVPALISLDLIIQQLLIVLGLLALCLLYPMWRIFRLNLVNALKGGMHAA